MFTNKNLFSNACKLVLCTVFILVSNFSFSQENKENDNFKKTDEVLYKVVEKALNVAEKTGEFVIEQAPLLLQEFYNWHIAKNSLGIIFGLILMYIGFNIRKIWGKKVDSNYSPDWNEVVIKGYASEEVSTWTTIIIGNIFGFVLLCKSLYNLIFLLTAPKLFLIEYFIK